MERWLARYQDLCYFFFRVMVGLNFMCHGGQKLLGFPPSEHAGGPLNGLTLTAGSIELVGGLLVALGLFGGYAAFLSSGLMAFAYFMAHFKLDWPLGFIPVVNKGELAVLYCFIFLFIAARGSGRYSLDQLLFHRWQAVETKT